MTLRYLHIKLRDPSEKALNEAVSIIKEYPCVQEIVCEYGGIPLYNISVLMNATPIDEILKTKEEIEQKLLKRKLIQHVMPSNIGWSDFEAIVYRKKG
jgi:hypothetical protein